MAEAKSARGSFPAKLYELVDSHSRVPDDEAVVTWCENGLAFIVRDLSRFCDEVLPHHFCHNKWASFIRQLNLYGFRRITQGQSSGAYWHKFFQRGEPHLLRGITRSRRQNASQRAAAAAQAAANPPEPAPSHPRDYARMGYGDEFAEARAGSLASAAWGGGGLAPMHAGVPLPPMQAVLPQLPPPPIISDEALLSELDSLVQTQKESSARAFGTHPGDMPPPPKVVDGAGIGLGQAMGSGSSLNKFLERETARGDGLRKRMASHQSIHSVGSFGQMTEIGGHGPDRKRTEPAPAVFRGGRRTNSKSSLASDDWDLNIADVDSLNLDDWRWSESQNGPSLGFGRSGSGSDFLRPAPALGRPGGFTGGLGDPFRRAAAGPDLGALGAQLPLADMPRTRSKEGLVGAGP